MREQFTGARGRSGTNSSESQELFRAAGFPPQSFCTPARNFRQLPGMQAACFAELGPAAQGSGLDATPGCRTMRLLITMLALVALTAGAQAQSGGGLGGG